MTASIGQDPTSFHTSLFHRARSAAHRLWRRWNRAEPFTPPERRESPLALRRVRDAGMVLLGLELLALCAWSYVLASRFSLTRDFSIYEQSAFEFAHGNFDP